MAWNFRRIIKEDQVELAASREKSLAASSLMEKATNGTSAPPGRINNNSKFSFFIFLDIEKFEKLQSRFLINQLPPTGCGVLLRRSLHPDHRGHLDSRRAGWPGGVRWDRGGYYNPVWVVGQDDVCGVAWAASGTGKSMF